MSNANLAKEKEISALKQQIASLETTISEHIMTIKDLKNGIENLLGQMQERLSKKDAEIKRLEGYGSGLEKDIGELNNHISSLTYEINKIKNERSINRYAYVVLPIIAVFFLIGIIYILYLSRNPIVSGLSYIIHAIVSGLNVLIHWVSQEGAKLMQNHTRVINAS